MKLTDYKKVLCQTAKAVAQLDFPKIGSYSTNHNGYKYREENINC